MDNNYHIIDTENTYNNITNTHDSYELLEDTIPNQLKVPLIGQPRERKKSEMT